MVEYILVYFKNIIRVVNKDLGLKMGLLYLQSAVRQFGLALCVMLIFYLPAFAHDTKNAFVLPSMNAGASFYEQYRNKQIAAWVHQKIHGELTIIDDPWSVQVLSQMATKMNATVRTVPLYDVVLIQDNSINAFAVTGGLIGINTGVVFVGDSLDEVASVIAHEIAHISQKHYEHQLDNRKKTLALQLGGLAASIFAAHVANGDTAMATMAGFQTVGAENMALHSREHEKEADRIGMQILAKSGYDARAMPRFFQRLSQDSALNHTKNAFIPSFVRSHPWTEDRLSEAVQRAENFSTVSMKSRHHQAVLFDRWKWRLKYLTGQVNETQLLANLSGSTGARLAYVSYLADYQRFDEAYQVYQAGDFDDSNPLECLIKGELFAKKRDYDQAVGTLQRCQRIYPERRDLRLSLANYHIMNHQEDRALSLLSPLVGDDSVDRMAWWLSYQAYKQKAQHQTETAWQISTIHALRTKAFYELTAARYTQALQLIAQATKIATDEPRLKSLLPMLQKSQERIEQAKDFQP